MKATLVWHQTLMSCELMEALPCRHIAEASFLSRVLHSSKWFSIFPDSRQNGSLKWATLPEMKQCAYILDFLS